MSFEKKRFCFYCKLDSDQLEKLNKSLKTCGICKLAQYCGKECQKLDFLPGNAIKGLSAGYNGSAGHKSICTIEYKKNMDLAVKTEKAMKAKRVNLDVTRTQKGFYEDNPAVFESVKASGSEFGRYRDLSSQILRGQNVDLGQLFMNYRATFVSVELLSDMAREHKSYYGLEIALDAYLDLFMKLQPFKLLLRALVPLMMIQLGRDDDAYNFIKFWLKNTPKSCNFQISEDEIFLKDLPFTEYTMKDQDKNEDIFEVLGIGLEKPYFLYVTFFISLAIIKKNNFDTTKDPKQMEHFKKTLKYIKCHFKNLVKKALDINVENGRYGRFTRVEPGTYVPARIPTSYGLQEGKGYRIGQVERVASSFLDNFCGDLDTYLDRKEGLRKEMLKFL